MSSALRVLTVASNKGGVGKTTLAVNLAVLARARNPDEPVLLVGLDDQDLIDRMFGAEAREGPDVAQALRAGDLRPAIRPGRYGVHYLPTSPAIGELKPLLAAPERLREALVRSGFAGLVVIDTKSDLEALTENALFASDLALVPVTDESSLREAMRVFERLERLGRPRERARTVLSLVDLRIKYKGGSHGDVLALLVAAIRAAGLPLLESFVSRSPRVEALHTNGGRPLPVPIGAPDSLVATQLASLAEDVLRLLPAAGLAPAPFERRADRRAPYTARLVAFRTEVPRLVELDAVDLSRTGLAAHTNAKLALGERLHVALRSAAGEPSLRWARVVRAGACTALRFEAPSPAAARALAPQAALALARQAAATRGSAA